MSEGWMDDLLKSITGPQAAPAAPEAKAPETAPNTIPEEVRLRALAQLFVIMHTVLGGTWYTNPEGLKSDSKGQYAVKEGGARLLTMCWLAAKPYIDGLPTEEHTFRQTVEKISAIAKEAKQSS